MEPAGSEMRQRILEVAITQIDKFGEETLRLRAVASAVGIKQPTLYHYFPSREDLIVAAHVERFRSNLAVTLNPFMEAIPHCTTREEFLEIVKGIAQNSFQFARREVRSVRAELIGTAQRRAPLDVEVRKAIDLSMMDTIPGIETAKERGWLRPSIDSRTFAIFNFSLITSAFIPESMDDEALLEGWYEMAIQALTAIVLADD